MYCTCCCCYFICCTCSEQNITYRKHDRKMGTIASNFKSAELPLAQSTSDMVRWTQLSLSDCSCAFILCVFWESSVLHYMNTFSSIKSSHRFLCISSSSHYAGGYGDVGMAGWYIETTVHDERKRANARRETCMGARCLAFRALVISLCGRLCTSLLFP